MLALKVFQLGLHVAKNRSDALDCIIDSYFIWILIQMLANIYANK